MKVKAVGQMSRSPARTKNSYLQADLTYGHAIQYDDFQNEFSLLTVATVKKKEEMPVYEGPLPRPANQSAEPDPHAEEVENPTAPDDPNAPSNWDEAQSPEGYTYYWNTITGGK